MTMRDELGVIFEDEDFADLFPRRAQPAMASWRLALVTIMQFAEGLSDRQTADAPCVLVLTGSMRSLWSWRIPGLRRLGALGVP
jgi:hypothetical protein